MHRGIPEPGDTLILQVDMKTLAGKTYDKGDEIHLIETTDEAPFGIRSAICNWRTRCKHYEPPQPGSVWSGVWHMLDNRWARLKKADGTLIPIPPKGENGTQSAE